MSNRNFNLMKETIKNLIAKNISDISGANIADILSLIEKPKNKEFGEYAFPCFSLAKAQKKAPPLVAKELSEKIKLPGEISQVIATGPFINFKIKRAAFTKQISESINKGNLYNFTKNFKKEKVVLEFSSPNIAKPFHVGHLRATLIGNSLDKIYRRLGHEVISINHLGDWGTQFGFVWAGCKLWGEPKNATVKDLVELYKKATALKEEHEKNPPKENNVNDMARAYFIDLEKGEEYAVKFWKWCLDVSLAYFKKTYSRLGVNFDHYTGESFYSDKLEDIKQEISSKNLLIESQGALGVDLGEKLGFARILTPDGRSLYLTRDLATAKYRAKTFNFDRAIYVVGTPQTLHFQQIKAVLKALGHNYSERIEHVGFGHVLGMKTRGAGEIVELNDFIDEAIERALTAYREQVSRRPEGLDENKVATAVGLSAFIFSTLSRGRLKDVNFSWDDALQFQGESGPYLLYAFARINGIKEKALEANIKLESNFNLKEIESEVAFDLANTLADFQDCLIQTTKENDPQILASYTIDLAKSFSKAYNELKVVGEEIDLAKTHLALFEATRIVLKECIELLGINTIERM